MKAHPSESGAEAGEQLLEQVNATLAQLGATGRWRVLPDLPAGCEVLRGRRVILVDDVRQVLESFMPLLVVATGGRASFVQYLPIHTPADVADEVLRHRPSQGDVVLLDGNLSRDVKGWDVAPLLRDAAPAATVVGFSSDRSTRRDFLDAGVDVVIEKEPGMPERSLAELAAALGGSAPETA